MFSQKYQNIEWNGRCSKKYIALLELLVQLIKKGQMISGSFW